MKWTSLVSFGSSSAATWRRAAGRTLRSYPTAAATTSSAGAHPSMANASAWLHGCWRRRASSEQDSAPA